MGNHYFVGHRWRQAGQYLFMTGKTVSHVVRLSGMRAHNIEQIRLGKRARMSDLQKFATTVRSLVPAGYRDFTVDGLPVEDGHAPPVYGFPNMVCWPGATDVMRTVYPTWSEAGREAELGSRVIKLLAHEEPVSNCGAVTLVHRINRWRDVQNNSRTDKLPLLHPYEVLYEPSTMRPLWVALMDAGEKPIEPKLVG